MSAGARSASARWRAAREVQQLAVGRVARSGSRRAPPQRLVVGPTSADRRVLEGGDEAPPASPGGTIVSLLSRTSDLARAPPRGPGCRRRRSPRLSSLRITRTWRLRAASTSRYSPGGSAEPLSTTISSYGELVGVREHALERPSACRRGCRAPGRSRCSPRGSRRRARTAGTGGRGSRSTRLGGELQRPPRDGSSDEVARERRRRRRARAAGRERPGDVEPDVVEHVAEHDLVAEVLAGDLAGGAAVARRVAPATASIASAASSRSREGEQALAGRQRVAEPGVLERSPAGPRPGRWRCAR